MGEEDLCISQWPRTVTLKSEPQPPHPSLAPAGASARPRPVSCPCFALAHPQALAAGWLWGPSRGLQLRVFSSSARHTAPTLPLHDSEATREGAHSRASAHSRLKYLVSHSSLGTSRAFGTSSCRPQCGHRFGPDVWTLAPPESAPPGGPGPDLDFIPGAHSASRLLQEALRFPGRMGLGSGPPGPAGAAFPCGRCCFPSLAHPGPLQMTPVLRPQQDGQLCPQGSHLSVSGTGRPGLMAVLTRLRPAARPSGLPLQAGTEGRRSSRASELCRARQSPLL